MAREEIICVYLRSSAVSSFSSFRLPGMLLAAFGEGDPGMLALAPHGVARRREGGIGEVADGDADRLGRELGIPEHRAAADRAEIVVDPAALPGAAPPAGGLA